MDNFIVVIENTGENRAVFVQATREEAFAFMNRLLRDNGKGQIISKAQNYKETKYLKFNGQTIECR